ncbi:MAG TPA: FAD:protein FMN transferase [Galbitalea sp.]|jgi:thiamine biosynthesis lipoprotein|nr:FAD:protein FMN transferase [Galbitalea sp.]
MPKAEWDFEAIGAPWRISTPDALPESTKNAIAARIEAFDATYSRFRPDSLVTRIAESTGTWEFPADARRLFTLYRTLYNATEGAMSPLVGGRLESLGYDRDYTLRPRAESVEVPEWDEILQWDGTRLTTTSPVLLDVGAAGKGYLVDLVAEVLRERGVDEYLVDASGDLLHRGDEPVRVGLEHPFDPELAVGVCELQNASICASASNRRSWGDGLHHILDATTGQPTTSVAATWAHAPSGLLADGLATALFFVSAPSLSASYKFDYVRMFPDSRVEYSREFPGELFT